MPEVTTEPETRDKILHAAHTIFVRQGIASARTQEIADEAGVNKALIHYYFGTKDELAREVLRRVHAELFPRLFGILGDPHRDIPTKVRALVEFEIDFLSRHPYLPGFVASEMHANPDLVAELFARMGPPPIGILQQQLDAEAKAGTMRPMMAPQFVVSLLAALVFPFVMRPMLEKLFMGPEHGFKEFLAVRRATLAEFFLAGLRP